ncbi:MAG: GspE/PulE family protein [Synechococcales cyanobacterium]
MISTRLGSPQTTALAIANSVGVPLAKALVASKILNSTQMLEVYKLRKETGKALTTIIQEMTGSQLPPDLERLYKRQELFELKVIYGVASFDLDTDEPDVNTLVPWVQEGTGIIPMDVCDKYKCLPIGEKRVERGGVSEHFLMVAMVEPGNLFAQDELRNRLRSRGMVLQRRVITPLDYQVLKDRIYDAIFEEQKNRPTSHQDDDDDNEVSNYQPADLDDLDEEEDVEVTGKLDDIDLDVTGLEEGANDEGESLEASLRNAEGAPIIRLANQILVKALQEGVSDIHIEPQEEYLRIRFRKDGVLRQAFDPLPKQIIPALTARFKILAELNISERRQPQDGRIRRKFKKRKVDFRVNTLPSRYGEKICMRILDNSSTKLGLDKLISDPDTLAGFRDIIQRPFGLILVTGPTGSGKTTTLYSALAEVNEPGINISTAEDPIEYSLPGITQVQVIREKGMNFAQILRAFLRQDPDVILVGETRDLETAKTAIEASLTGHLVLTTLHTNDAPGAIIRLEEMGVEPFNISSALLGVIAQRLMRRVCDNCRIPYQPSSEELALYGILPSPDGEPYTFYKANSLGAKEIKEAKKNRTLCPKCSGSGYKGRVGVYEFMRMNEKIAELINKEAPTEVIKEAAVEAGMKTLLSYSLMMVRQGSTTIEEVNRVVLTDKGLEAERKAAAKSLNTCRTCGAKLEVDWMECPYCLTPKFT